MEQAAGVIGGAGVVAVRGKMRHEEIRRATLVRRKMRHGTAARAKMFRVRIISRLASRAASSTAKSASSNVGFPLIAGFLVVIRKANRRDHHGRASFVFARSGTERGASGISTKGIFVILNRVRKVKNPGILRLILDATRRLACSFRCAPLAPLRMT